MSIVINQGFGIRIDSELQKFLPKLTAEEFSQLEKNLLADPSRIVLVVWEEKNVILDGHHRYDICQKHKIPFDIKLVSFPSLDDAKLWMIKHQLGQRNLNSLQRSYFRGKQYEMEKKMHGDPSRLKSSSGQNDHLNTRERIAQEHGVSESTIHRDAKFARAVDAIQDAISYAAGLEIIGMNLTDQEVRQLAEIAEDQAQTARNVLDQIKSAKTPQEKKQVLHRASRNLPKKAKKAKKTKGKKKPASGELFPQLVPVKSIEPVQLKRGTSTDTGYIVRNPESEPVFNRTNEMVDWASWTWNPVTGCWHGCNYCYARAIANSSRMADVYPKQFEPTFYVARLNAPKNTPFPKLIERPEDRNVFVCSMADLFGKWVPDEWITQVFEQVRRYPQWNYLFLTKFPQRLRAIHDLLKGFPNNAWVGCTVDSQARVKPAQDAFRGLKAKVRWLSVEPMQERLTFSDMSMFDWLAMGGKSASDYNKTPAFQPEWEWVEHLYKQARNAGVKIFFKDNLESRPKEVPWS